MTQTTLAHGEGARPMESNYTWYISENRPPGDERSRKVATVGPPGAKKSVPIGTVIQKGQRFSLVTSEGSVLYTGYIYGDYLGREPLADFGWQNGCTQIEFDEDNEAT